MNSGSRAFVSNPTKGFHMLDGKFRKRLERMDPVAEELSTEQQIAIISRTYWQALPTKAKLVVNEIANNRAKKAFDRNQKKLKKSQSMMELGVPDGDNGMVGFPPRSSSCPPLLPTADVETFRFRIGKKYTVAPPNSPMDEVKKDPDV